MSAFGSPITYHPLDMRRALLTLLPALAALAILPAVALAAPSIVPPGNSEADQYAETVPGAEGNKPPDSGRPPEDVLTPSQIDELGEQGADGEAAAALAAATAPEGGGSGSGSAGSAGEPGESGGAGGDSEGGSAVGSTSTPTAAVPSEDGLGFVLWIVLAAGLAGAAAYVAARRRSFHGTS